MKDKGWRELKDQERSKKIADFWEAVSLFCVLAVVFLAIAVVCAQASLYFQHRNSRGSSLTGTQPQTP